MNFRPVLFAFGLMTVLLGLMMVPCGLIDLADGEEEWHVFVVSAFFAMIAGGCVMLLARGGDQALHQRESFLLTVGLWFIMPVMAAIPFLFSGLSFTDAMFESISGLTTTGSTVITGLQEQPRGLLLWRSLLTWFGGAGFILTAILLLPELRVGGMQLFRLENTDQSGKFASSVTQIGARILAAYLILSAICTVLYLLCGMSWFDAINHMMTTLSCGGFSTYDASFGEFAASPAPWVACIFMMLAAMPFSLFAILFFQGRIAPMLKDPQPRLLWTLALLITLIVFAYRVATLPADSQHPLQAFKESAFNVISIMTGTGYATTAYDLWGAPVMAIMLGATFLGGCAGSGACGIKMFRLEIAGKALIASVQRMSQPHRKAVIRFGNKVVDDDTLQSVMVFLFLYFSTFLIGSALVALSGVDALSAISGVAASIANCGPGLGPIVGPSGTFQPLNDFATWVNAICMLLGRLEFVAVFVVLTARFWRG